MNKKIIMMCAVVGMTIGGLLPMLWGDDNFIDVPSILFGMVGGFAGIWLGVWASKRYF